MASTARRRFRCPPIWRVYRPLRRSVGLLARRPGQPPERLRNAQVLFPQRARDRDDLHFSGIDRQLHVVTIEVIVPPLLALRPSSSSLVVVLSSCPRRLPHVALGPSSHLPLEPVPDVDLPTFERQQPHGFGQRRIQLPCFPAFFDVLLELLGVASSRRSSESSSSSGWLGHGCVSSSLGRLEYIHHPHHPRCLPRRSFGPSTL